jgi:hypothetical protein
MLKKVKRIKLGIRAYRRIMKRVLERDGWRCQKCGSLKNLQVHHKIKRSQQGSDSLVNLVTLCAYCHMAEHGQLFYSVDIFDIREGSPCCRTEMVSDIRRRSDTCCSLFQRAAQSVERYARRGAHCCLGRLGDGARLQPGSGAMLS